MFLRNERQKSKQEEPFNLSVEKLTTVDNMAIWVWLFVV